MENSIDCKYINQKNVFLMNLPSDILVEILSRLPARAVFRCKCVCKTWIKIFSDSKFVALHFAKARPGIVVHQSEMFKNLIKVVEFEDEIDHHNLDEDSLVKFDLKRISEFSGANIVLDGSVNGLICLRDSNYEHESVYICNPITREYVRLPSPKGVVRYPSMATYGFGVSRVSSEYKVVRVFHDQVLDPVRQTCIRIPRSECHVYTLGTGSWRSINGNMLNFAYGRRCRSVGLFFNGNIHWLIKDLDDTHEMISCFNLENEVFQPFPAPFPGMEGLLGSLGVLHDCLCLCDNTSHCEINIWVMKEYGVEKSWNRQFVITKMTELTGPTLEVVYPFKIFKDGVIMVLWGDFFMLYCCNKSNVGQEVDLDQPRGPNKIEAMLHVSSFVSLKNFGFENVCNF
ncbi:F-box At3g07870-like [Olea europaea subsp. europaea]|uniref:F-box At3g07870-like n=1 Tax=Olea europaea subsp. europaea TaxID=158383 RepID=A0A8S0TGC1_OLEEU|nr:F-box At3g07870-like [Olea europaea subsp. europaea]